MKEFKPSDNFVSRVMINVLDYEKTKGIPLTQKLVSSRLLRYAMSTGGLLLGIWNIIRLYFPVFAPAVCR